MRGYILTFDGQVSTPTSYLNTSKLHCNSVILTPGSKYLVVDVKNFYLNNIMAKHEYYRISNSLIPQEVIDEYNPLNKQINSFLYVRVEKVIYHTQHSRNISDRLDRILRQSLRNCVATTRMVSNLP